MAGGRTLREEEHLAPWLEINPNKVVVNSSSKLGQEEELLVDGLTYEDYKVYELDEIHQSFGAQVTKLNIEITKKVNRLGKERIGYKEAVLFGGSASDIELAGENISNLRKLIVKLQAIVESLGGVYFKIPDKFDDVLGK